jgi:HEAT repeat protein
MIAFSPEMEAVLLKGCFDKDAKVSRRYCHVFYQRPFCHSVFSAIRKAMTNKSPEIRIAALNLVGILDYSKAGNTVKSNVCRLVARRLSKDQDPTVRTQAAHTMGILMNPSAVYALNELTTDTDAVVRAAAVDALCKLRARPGTPSLVAYLKTAQTKEDDASICRKRDAIKALGHMGDLRGVLILIRYLSDQADRYLITQSMAAEALGRIGDRRAVLPLIRALKSNDKKLVSAAAWALGQIADPRGFEPVLKVARSTGEPAIAAASALGAFRNPKAIKPIIKLLYAAEASGPNERDKALVQSLGKIRSPEVLRSLIEDLPESFRGYPADVQRFLKEETGVEYWRKGKSYRQEWWKKHRHEYMDKKPE